MKKILLSSALIVGLGLSSFGQINTPSTSPGLSYTTNVTGLTYGLVVTNNSKIAQVILIGGATATNGFQVDIYDNSSTNLTYTNAAFTNFIGYSTNFAIAYVSTLSGMTNTYTNTMYFETNVVTAAGTNNLPLQSFLAPAGVMVSYPVNLLNAKGIAFKANTNGTLVIRYRLSD